jgi:hypothetical protein
VAALFVLVDGDGIVVGYYTLSATAVLARDLPDDLQRKLPPIPTHPGHAPRRSGRGPPPSGSGTGPTLLADALFRALHNEIASFAVVVEAKDDAARRFYERESFLLLPEQPMRLFRRMADIADLFA